MSESRIPNHPSTTQQATEEKLVRSELNLELNKIFAGLKRGQRSREIVSQEQLPSGDVIERRIIVGRTHDGTEVGDLTPYHFLVCLALEELWEKAGKPLYDVVPFTTLKLMQRLGMDDSGEEYERIKGWIRDLRQRPITFVNAFYSSDNDEHIDLSDITVLSHLHIYERRYHTKRAGKKTRGYGEFQFDRHILQSLIENYAHPIRLDVAKGFDQQRERAILLYTYLDRNLAFRSTYEVGLEKLFNHVGFGQDNIPYPAKRKQRLEPIVKQLEGVKLSSGKLSYCRIQKTRDGKDYKLVARKRQSTSTDHNEANEPEHAATLPQENASLAEKLRAHGLTASQITELTPMGETVLQRQLEALPYRIQLYRDRKESVNAAALLYQSIKQNWTLPHSYLAAKKQVEREAKAKHFVLWSCRNIIDECSYSRKAMSTPHEKGTPDACPACGSTIEILNRDYIVYPNEKT